jgi:hypothetical protein
VALLVVSAIDGEISIPRAFTFEELRNSEEQIVERSLLLGGRSIKATRPASHHGGFGLA